MDRNLLLYFLLIKLINRWNLVQNVTLCSYVACTTLGESKGIYHFVKGCIQALALLDSNDLTQRSVESNQCYIEISEGIIFRQITTPNHEFLLAVCWSLESKVLSLLEACFDLISSPSPSMKIQIMGRKITENLGFESSLWKVNLFVLFVFIFEFSIKIFDFNRFWMPGMYLWNQTFLTCFI